MKRGACPSLSAPMQTGDGLLARLNPAHGGLTSRQLAGVAKAAGAFGNGVLEISARGSLQIRGLTAASAKRLEAATSALDIEAHSGPEIRTGPLAGLDPMEIADPRPLAREIRESVARLGLAATLAPKMSVTVDGVGRLSLSGIAADVRLEAAAAQRWTVRIGGFLSGSRLLGEGDADRAVAVAVEALKLLAAHGRAFRGRDLDQAALALLAEGLEPGAERERRPTVSPVGRFELRDGKAARGVALAFGQIGADALEAFARVARKFRLAPGRALVALDLSPAEDESLAVVAETLGMVTRPDDPRLAIAACAGAPACASAHLPVKAIAREIAAPWPGLPNLHLSGCAKQCARPAGPHVSLVGGAEGFEIMSEGEPVPAGLRALLARLAEKHGATERRRRA